MALDLLLLAAPAHALVAACRRGYWPPLPLRSFQARHLTHLAVLAPEAEAIKEVAEIEHLLLWFEQNGQRWWLPLLGRLRSLRRPIAAGRGPALDRWRPRTADDVRLLSIDGLLLCDSLADYLQRLRRNWAPLDLTPDPEPPQGRPPQGGSPPSGGSPNGRPQR